MKWFNSGYLLKRWAALCIAATSFVVQGAPYDLKEAQNKLVEFAPGVVSTDKFEINTVFNRTGDEVIFSLCTDDFSHCVMMESVYENGAWQSPVPLPFSGKYPEGDPYYSSDYTTLYFISKRPVDGSNKATENFNLWYAKRDDNGWQTPVYMKQLSSQAHDLYPSLTDDGRLVFLSFRNQQRHMYQISLQENTIAKPIQLPEHIYGVNGKVGDSMITRDGQHIIFSISDREDSLGRGDLYISHLQNGQWSVAKSLGEMVNSKDHEFTPILSPDNQYLFFTRIENGKGNLYQIALSSLGIIL